MQLIDIDKAKYRKHLNIVIIGFISALLALSLLFGAVFISLFSTVAENALAAVDAVANGIDPGEIEPESNFKYNLAGVILALLLNAAILHSIKGKEYFKEIYYVWQLKQIQNLIYRKLKSIKSSAESGNEKALVILHFYYQSQMQVYKLDDNTLTLNTVETALGKVKEQMTEHGLQTSEQQQFDKTMLNEF